MSIHVTVAVAFAVPGPKPLSAQKGEIILDLSPNATIADALCQAGFDLTDIASVGVWGKVRPLTFVLREDDRVEIYRPLQADPKAARRARDDGSTQKKRKT